MESTRQKFSHRMFNTVVISWDKQLLPIRLPAVTGSKTVTWREVFSDYVC